MAHLYFRVESRAFNTNKPEGHWSGVNDSEANSDVGDELVEEFDDKAAARGEAAGLIDVILRSDLRGGGEGGVLTISHHLPSSLLALP